MFLALSPDYISSVSGFIYLWFCLCFGVFVFRFLLFGVQTFCYFFIFLYLILDHFSTSLQLDNLIPKYFISIDLSIDFYAINFQFIFNSFFANYYRLVFLCWGWHIKCFWICGLTIFVLHNQYCIICVTKDYDLFIAHFSPHSFIDFLINSCVFR